MRLLTNNPFKIKQMTNLGLKISSQVPIQIPPGLYNRKYLKAKREKMMHNLDASHFDDSLDTNSPESSPEIQVTASKVPVIIPEIVFSAEEIQQRRRYAFGRGSVEAAIDAIKRGEVVVVVDDENRENEVGRCIQIYALSVCVTHYYRALKHRGI